MYKILKEDTRTMVSAGVLVVALPGSTACPCPADMHFRDRRRINSANFGCEERTYLDTFRVVSSDGMLWTVVARCSC